MQSNNPMPKHVKGWLFDVYPSDIGEVAVWIISENGGRVRLKDSFQPKIYVSGKQDEIERLASSFFSNQPIASWKFAYRYAQPTDNEKSRVLEITLKDCRKTSAFTRQILKQGNYLRYQVHNCDLHGDRHYFFSHNLFPLAKVEVEVKGAHLKYTLKDSVKRVHYSVPPLRVLKLDVEIAKAGKIASFKDSIKKIVTTQADQQIVIDYGDEKGKLLQLVRVVNELDPDIILTSGGDSYLFPYLIYRATINNVMNQFSLNRGNIPFISKVGRGRTFFSYGRTFYKAATMRLYGRVHVDRNNTFILNEADFDGLFEIARTCRVPLHTAARSSIGSSMSSLQFYQAIEDDILIPRNKSIPEAFKSAYELLVGDRGGVVYEPEVGIHDNIGEVDFSSMYPILMVKNNISAETVFCKCCPNSYLRIPDLNYHICEKRVGIVPKALDLVVSKRLQYKSLKNEIKDEALRDVYDKRQAALKWILVTCFGYLGYRNAKFGTVDGHMGVCAFGRDTFLKAARMAENRGFEVIHGIVDSLWLKKKNATLAEYTNLCREVSEKIGVPLNFEGRYKWIVFLPSKMHPNIGVLNRYYGAMENGKVKVRGIEVRRRDTPRFVFNAQMEMINVLASANDSRQFMKKVPEALDVVKEYRQLLLDGDVPIWDLVITKRLSKHPSRYKQRISQVIAAEQLMKEGAEVHAGKNVRFLFTDAKNKKYRRRVRAEQLIERGVNPDLKKYLLLLYASAAGLLSFAGYTTAKVYESVRGHGHKNCKITDFSLEQYSALP
jgi:DNA polymerase elongation subunit (family B)